MFIHQRSWQSPRSRKSAELIYNLVDLVGVHANCNLVFKVKRFWSFKLYQFHILALRFHLFLNKHSELYFVAFVCATPPLDRRID